MTGRTSLTTRLSGACVVAALLVTGCAGMPESGPVVPTEVDADDRTDRSMAVDAAPPPPGASPADIALGFLEAMEASPIRLEVARQYLSSDAQPKWDPERATIVHRGLSLPTLGADEVTIRMNEAEALDRRGAWQGVLPQSGQRLDYRMVREAGEWRIVNPDDALIVSSSWFESRYSEASLYFFDRTAELLVPEPVFVAGGEQLATRLMEGLLAGPPDELGASARSFLPAATDLELSVPVTASGVAEIALVGGSAPQDPELVERLLAQVAWTLRQDPSVTAFTLSVGDSEVRLPGGGTNFPVTFGAAYDPVGPDTETDLFGLREGVVVTGSGSGFFAPVTGPFGASEFGVRSVAVSLDGEQVAAVTGDGTALVRTATEEPDDLPEGGEVPVDSILSDAADLADPVWDARGRLWAVDRRSSGAEVYYFNGTQPVALEVPGVTGARVQDFLVSRDATRFVATVRVRGLDQVRVGRLRTGEQGQRVVAGATRALRFDGSDQLRTNDLEWASLTRLAVLSTVEPGELYEVREIAVDGVPPGLSPPPRTVRGRVRQLISAADPDQVAYARTPTDLIPLSGESATPLSSGITSLSYPG